MKLVEHAKRIRKRRWQEALTKTQAKAHQFFMLRGTTASLLSDLRPSDYIASPHASIGGGKMF